MHEISNVLPEKVTLSIRDELLISEDLDTEVDQAAYRFGYYAVLAEKAAGRASRLKMVLEFWEADETKKVIEERERDHKKPYTESQMKAYIHSNQFYKIRRYEIEQAAEQANILDQIARAFDKRTSMVQTKAANRRKEIEGV